MNGNFSRFIKSILLTGDLIAINIAFALGYLIKFKTFTQLANDEYFVLFIVFNFSWVVAAFVLREYDKERMFLLDKMATKLVRLLVLHTLLITAFWVVRKAFFYSREQLMWTLIILFPLVFLWRALFSFYIKNYRKKGYNFRRIIIAGDGEMAQGFAQVLKKNKDYGYKILGMFSSDPKPNQDILPLDDIQSFCEENAIDEIYCSSADLETNQMKKLIDMADNNIVRAKIIPDVRGLTFKRLSIDFFEHIPILSLRSLPLDDRFNRMMKRIFDITFSLLFIIFIMSWLYPIIAVLIKTSSPGPVLFKQKRSGENNDIFNCLKFRSMRVNADSDKVQATKGDPRLTKIGRFIRKTSIDETPQFFNVLIGDMSIVGPRPHMIKHTEQYSQLINKYMVRHFVKPGITGLAQVKGYRGETKDPKMMENRIRLDMVYVESWTVAMDIWIIFRTIFTVFVGNKNAY